MYVFLCVCEFMLHCVVFFLVWRWWYVFVRVSLSLFGSFVLFIDVVVCLYVSIGV